MRRVLVFLIAILLLSIVGCKTTEKNYQLNFDNSELVPFSRDGGKNYLLKDDQLEAFDVYQTEESGYVFFYAYTHEELKEKINQNKKPNLYTYNYPDDQQFNTIIENYNDAFFEDHILIFYYKFEPNVSKNYAYALSKKGNTLTLNINRFEGHFAALTGWIEIITVKKEEIKDIKKIEVIIRTISSLQESIIFSIKEEYIREFYINDLTIEDFKGIKNLKKVTTFQWSLGVDVVFKEKISEAELQELVTKLEKCPKIKSIGYKGQTHIKIIIQGKYFDEVINENLDLTTILDQSDIDQYQISLRYLDFTPFGFVTFYLENPGKANADKLAKDILEKKHPYLEDKAWQ
ncbi:MAG: hypothetical protein ACOX5X_00960 [Acholeplasmataceae bacterium]